MSVDRRRVFTLFFLLGVLVFVVYVWLYYYSCTPVEISGLRFEHCAIYRDDSETRFVSLYSVNSDDIFSHLLASGHAVPYFWYRGDTGFGAVVGSFGDAAYSLAFNDGHAILLETKAVSNSFDIDLLNVEKNYLSTLHPTMPHNAFYVLLGFSGNRFTTVFGDNVYELCNLDCNVTFVSTYCFTEQNAVFSLLPVGLPELQEKYGRTYFCGNDTYVEVYTSSQPVNGPKLNVFGPFSFTSGRFSCVEWKDDGKFVALTADECINLYCVEIARCVK